MFNFSFIYISNRFIDFNFDLFGNFAFLFKQLSRDYFVYSFYLYRRDFQDFQSVSLFVKFLTKNRPFISEF